MTTEEIISDIREILNAVDDDSDIENEWLYDKFNRYRAVVIQEKFNRDLMIDPSWQLQTEILQTTQTDPSNDPNVEISSISLSKVTIPEVISLPNDLGLILTGAGGVVPFEAITLTQMGYKASIQEEIDPGMGFYARIGTTAFFYPLMLKVKATLIPADPLEIKVLENGVFRARVLTDPYPIDLDSAQKMVIAFLTNDMKIKIETISDLVNDSQDQFKIMNDGARRQN